MKIYKDFKKFHICPLDIFSTNSFGDILTYCIGVSGFTQPTNHARAHHEVMELERAYVT